MLRYAGMLDRELRARGHDVTVAYPPTVVLKLLPAASPLAKWVGYIDKYLIAPSSLQRAARQADLVHVCDHSNSMYLGLCGKTPAVITCHDLMAIFAAQGRYPAIRISATGRTLQRWIASGLRNAKAVICVSHKTAEDLRELGGSPSVSVVHNPLNWDFHPVAKDQTARVLAANGLAGDADYLIHVGSNSWYKNRPAVVRIFAALKQSSRFRDTRLLLAGKPGDAELRQVIADSGVADSIHELHTVSNEDLRALYSGARALLFPSREEGFGWPILEAQACGCPVITTNRAPMTEVAGGAAILIDPQDASAAAALILSEIDRLPELAASGLRNAALFSVSRAMDHYVEAYEAAIARQQARPSA